MTDGLDDLPDLRDTATAYAEAGTEVVALLHQLYASGADWAYDANGAPVFWAVKALHERFAGEAE